MIYTELNFVVRDVKEAKKFYDSVFDIQIVKESDLDKGLNEVIFKMYNSTFHMLDENPVYMLYAREDVETPLPIWSNLVVEDIDVIYEKVQESGTKIIQQLQTLSEYKVKNFLFLDPFGFLWLVQEVIND